MYSPTKLGTFEKKCIEDSLTYSVAIIIKSLPQNPLLYLNVIVRILDKNVTYYTGYNI